MAGTSTIASMCPGDGTMAEIIAAILSLAVGLAIAATTIVYSCLMLIKRTSNPTGGTD